MNLLCQKLIIAIWVISNAEMYSSEVMTIERRLKPPTDVFTIPVSKCDNKHHFCQEYNAKEDVFGCQCYCEFPNATFALYQHSWSCVGSEVARTFTGEFVSKNMDTYFDNSCSFYLVEKDT